MFFCCELFTVQVCSDLNKPNGQYILEADQTKILEFIKDLPIRKAPGILHHIIKNVSDLDLSKFF